MESTVLNSISLFQLEEKHLPDVRWLIKTVFNKSFSIRYLKKKYRDLYGIGPIASVAYDKNQIVGFYGAIAQEFKSDNSIIRVAHACDSYTLKAFQGKGIHFQLANFSYELMKSKGFKFVYAFHSDNTFHSTKKLGWLEREEMVRFHHLTGSFPFAKVWRKLKLQSLYQQRVKSILDPYLCPDFEYFSEKSHQVMDHNFYVYKNELFPHYCIELQECVFYVKVDAIMHVGFFSFHNQTQLKKALEELFEIAKKIGVNEVLFQCSVNSKMYEGLVNELIPLPSWKIGYLPFEPIDLTAFEFTYANLDTF